MNRAEILDFEGTRLCWTTWKLVDFSTDELPQYLRLVAEPVNPWKIEMAGYAKTIRISTPMWNTSYPVIEDRRLLWQSGLGMDGFRVNQDWVPKDGCFRMSTMDFTIELCGRHYEEVLDSAMDGSCSR